MSTTEDHGAGGAAPPKGRAKACTACRQVKLKCDAKEVYPNPCTRCKAQDLDCRMDPTFKRVPARRQLEEVSERLINLQRSLGLNEDSSAPAGPAPPPPPPATATLPYFERLAEPSEREPRRRVSTDQESSDSFGHFEDEATFLDLQDEVQEGSWTLGEVTFTYPEILSLFQHFDTVLSRHAPFLEPCRSIHELYQKNDLLFWTLLMISCRFYNAYDETYLQLIPHHRTLIAMRTFNSRVTLGTIHSLLLQCSWPYPVNSQHDDITWVLCGVALNLAMTMGLHRPNHAHEYLLKDDDPVVGSPFTRKMTWLACFQISTSIASWLGLPPSISSNAQLETVDILCQDSTLPKAYRGRVEIQRQVARITNALEAKLDFRTRYSLIKLYEQDLDRLRTTFDEAWSDNIEVEWLGAKLYLFGMAFLPSSMPPSETDNRARAAGAREILQYGLAAASKMLNTIANIRLPPTMPDENQTGTSNYVYQLAFYPKQIFRIGAFATFFLIWYLAVDVQASESDKNLARNHVEFVCRLLYSVKHSPEHLKAAKSIEMLARFETLAPETRHQAATLLVNSRLGASFMYSLNYMEEEDCMSLQMQNSKLLEPPQLAVGADSFNSGGGSSSHAGSTPSQTTGHTAGSQRWLGSDYDVNSPESQQQQQQQHPQSSMDGLSMPFQHLPRQQQPQQQRQVKNPVGPTMANLGGSAMPFGSSGSNRGNSVRPNPLPPHLTVTTGMAPSYDPNSIFSNAFFQDAGHQNFDFLWQEWDPTVFDDLKMDIDDQMGLPSGAVEMGGTAGTTANPGPAAGPGPGAGAGAEFMRP